MRDIADYEMVIRIIEQNIYVFRELVALSRDFGYSKRKGTN
jgi:hypothetical protein